MLVRARATAFPPGSREDLYSGLPRALSRHRLCRHVGGYLTSIHAHPQYLGKQPLLLGCLQVLRRDVFQIYPRDGGFRTGDRGHIRFFDYVTEIL